VSQFLSLTANGLAKGAVFAAVALALVLIWRSTRIVNFAQGGMAMISAFVALKVIDGTGSYWLGFLAGLAAGFALGAVLERVLIRWVEDAPPLNAVIVTLGLLILLQAVAGMLFGLNPRPFPTAVSEKSLSVGATNLLSRFDLFIIVAVLLVMVALAVLFTRTPVGLRMRASAFAPEVSRLVGVRVGRMLTLGWALAAVVGALAAMLVVAGNASGGLSPNALDVVFVSGFTAAIVGGLDSPVGAVIGGLVVGLVLSYAVGYLDPQATPLAAFVMLIGVLLVRPGGLFAPAQARVV